MIIEIKRTPTREVLLRVDAETLSGANLKDANLRGADLSHLNLSGAILSGANLRGANMAGIALEGANLDGAFILLGNLRDGNLKRASLKGANLEGAVLKKADLSGANFEGANLFGAAMADVVFDESTIWPEGFDPVTNRAARSGTNGTAPPRRPPEQKIACPRCAKDIPADAKKCRHCGEWLNKPTEKGDAGLKILGGGGEVLLEVNAETLQGIDLSKANLSGANLINANLRKAMLREADLSRAALKGANLEDADLTGANLSGANLGEADLTGAKLFGAFLRGASLEGAVLFSADLRDTNLRESNLVNADLRGALLSGANLFGAHLTNARHDKRTMWPAGFGNNDPKTPVDSDVELADATCVMTERARCPICAEEILADAIKCRYCGEWLNRKKASPKKDFTRTLFYVTVGLFMLAGAVLVVNLVYPQKWGQITALAAQPHEVPPSKSVPKPDATAPAEAPTTVAANLEFPSFSVGEIETREKGSEAIEGWRKLGEAKGSVAIPPDRDAKLTVNDSTRDLSFLKPFVADSLHTLDLTLAPIGDNELANAESLTQLKELYLPPQITDAGLAHMKPLISLRTLLMFDAKISDAGLENLSGLTTLESVYVPKTISDDAIESLKQHLVKCEIRKY